MNLLKTFVLGIFFLLSTSCGGSGTTPETDTGPTPSDAVEDQASTDVDAGPAGDTVIGDDGTPPEDMQEDVWTCTPDCDQKVCGDDGCGGNCGECDAGFECTDSGQSCLEICVPQCDDKECGPDGCGAICGLCGPSKTCNAEGLCESDITGSVPFGGECFVTEECALIEPEDFSPDNQSEWSAYYQCLNSQCTGSSGQCSIMGGGTPVCTKSCGSGDGMTAEEDGVNNTTGAAGPDGIEDTVSLCSGADPNGPYGDQYRCVEMLNPQVSGQSYSQCEAGTDFKVCTVNSDCPAGESCQSQQIFGELGFRCMTEITNGVAVGELCETNPYNPTLWFFSEVAHCSSGICFWIGCSGVCADNNDCVTSGAQCNPNGTCAGSGAISCSSDADCSAWECKTDFVWHSAPPLIADACFPRNCGINSDCGDSNFYCKWGVNPDSFQPEGFCLRKPEGTVSLGDTCADSFQFEAGDSICSNPFECVETMCGGNCATNADCNAGNQVCAGLDFSSDTDEDGSITESDTYAVKLQCLPHTGSLTECTKESECGVPGEGCKAFQLPELACADDPDWTDSFSDDGCEEYAANAESWCGIEDSIEKCAVSCGNCTAQTGLAFKCYQSPNAGFNGGHGASCDYVDQGCQNGECSWVINGTLGETMCVDSCSEQSDCPQNTIVLGGTAFEQESQSVCTVSGTLYRNGTYDRRDDLYRPTCQPVPVDSSLADCSTASPGVGNPDACESGEFCVALPIATNANLSARVDFRCVNESPVAGHINFLWGPGGASLGAECSWDGGCSSGHCSSTGAGGICTTLCDPSDASACSQGNLSGMSCQKQVLIPRFHEDLEAFIYTCQP